MLNLLDSNYPESVEFSRVAWLKDIFPNRFGEAQKFTAVSFIITAVVSVPYSLKKNLTSAI